MGESRYVSILYRTFECPLSLLKGLSDTIGNIENDLGLW